MTESQRIYILLKGVDDRDYSATKDPCDTKNYMEKSSIKEKAIQLNKAGQTRSNQYGWSNQTCRSGGGPRNGINHNNVNEKDKET